MYTHHCSQDLLHCSLVCHVSPEFLQVHRRKDRKCGSEKVGIHFGCVYCMHVQLATNKKGHVDEVSQIPADMIHIY